ADNGAVRRGRRAGSGRSGARPASVPREKPPGHGVRSLPARACPIGLAGPKPTSRQTRLQEEASMLLEQQRTLDIDGQSLTIEDVVWCARAGGNGSLSPGAAAAVERTHRLKHDLVDREIPIYGVTTGFGDSAHRQIAPAKAAALQQNLLRNLGAG